MKDKDEESRLYVERLVGDYGGGVEDIHRILVRLSDKEVTCLLRETILMVHRRRRGENNLHHCPPRIIDFANRYVQGIVDSTLADECLACIDLNL